MKKLNQCAMLLGLFMMSLISNAQDYIVVHGNNIEPRFHKVENYNTLDIENVFNHPLTQDGDTVYFPGVTFSLNADLFLTKSLILMGTGIHPDSAIVAGSGVTTFAATNTFNEFILMPGSDGTQFHGINFSGTTELLFGNDVANGAIDGVVISRCRANIYLRNTTSNTTVLQSWCYIEFAASINNNVYNSVITGPGPTGGSPSTHIWNCIILNKQFNSSSGGNGTVYSNCIITRNFTGENIVSSDATFSNNLWITSAGTLTFSGSAINQGNHVLSTNVNQVFVNAEAINPLTTFTYNTDYHLNPDGPNYDLYTNGINGNGQIGIYGGMFPWKDGILPFAPHWLELTVPGNATQNGLTGITIKDSAQND